MASPSDCPDQSQPDPNENPNPNQPQESPKVLGPEALQPQHKPDDQEDLIEEDAHVDDPDLFVPSSPPNTDLHVNTPRGFRRGGGPRGKKAATKRRAQEKKDRKKLEILSEVLKPIPFVPNKTLDFSSHEKLLKRLGLWDFVHLEFDRDLRIDLIAQLIATYNSQARGSYVNGWRVGVNRADLARALKLSKKKDKDSVVDIEESKELVGFLEDFMSNWLLLHEDTWMMPVEVMNWTKMIEECHFEKVDWAGLIWFMVEKELTAAPNLKNCYYASHLQCLIKFQKEELLLEKPENEVYDAKEEEEEHNVPGDFKLSSDLVNESHEGSQLEEHNIELSLGGQDNLMNEDGVGKEAGGQDNLMNKDGVKKEAVVGDEDGMDCEESKEDEPRLVQWHLDGDFKLSSDLVNESHEGSQLDEHNIELSLGGQDNLMNEDGVGKEAGGQDNLMNKDGVKKEAVVGNEDGMDCEESKEDEPRLVQWDLDGDSHMDVGRENFLRQCDLGDVDMVEEKKQDKREEVEMSEGEEMGEGEEGGKEEEHDGHEEQEEQHEEQDEQEEQHGEGFPISPISDNLQGLHSTNLLEGMETANLSFTTGLHIRDNSSGEFLVSKVDVQTVPAVSSFLGNGNKREIDHEDDISRNSLNGSNKRLRTDGHWDKSSEFDICMGQMQHLMEKARMLYAAKEQACEDSSMNQQVMLHELQRRDNLIEHLQKAKFEEQQKRQMEVYRLERELYLMEDLLNGYRKALKETNRAFAEYRARCPLPDESLYKDVIGSGGLVLSTREIEKQRLKQEEEERLNRQLIENKIKDFEAGWIGKFDAHKDVISLLSNKLVDVENEVKRLKELSKRKVSGTSECIPNEMEMCSQ
ncbi:Sodium/calcium exchanger family protein / calcium-binding EF hand family protein isoform 1 [Hibiscus syriacus]|uniref:Sodium/calcium exchanger family protein / calcium-binding EF hand family protein isoform 1 n=1 Tax=Hibiscus syriacus TaxID=106335 RepID=A0A6A2YN84_HIBSY|nr:Sodium/calcium exchanger family protein / calcium-binding EF hand family protein isoform 1 [Hibiscus syriacus]